MPLKLSPSEQVTQFIKTSQHPCQVMQAVRDTILSIDDSIAEHIKWNAPAYYYNGEISALTQKNIKEI